MANETTVRSVDVLEALATLRDARVDVWVAGGWAVDALVGEQTREQRDLDLAIRAEHLDRVIAAVDLLGYRFPRKRLDRD